MAVESKKKTGIFRNLSPEKIKHVLVGGARDIQDPHLFHKVSLIAFLAWVGLGADGLSSSAYGPHEAFLALHEQSEKYGINLSYMAVWLALATSLTVFIISYAYSRIIEHFPTGGGGYVVATKLLGSHAGLVSGSALLVDYILTITVSIASGADAIFDFLPQANVLFSYAGENGPDGHPLIHAFTVADLKLPVEYLTIFVLLIMNLRGIKESITVLVPIFLMFCLTHIVMLGAVFFTHAGVLGAKYHEFTAASSHGYSTLGTVALFAVFISAFSRGAGTFTGIEAVSNGLAIMREPKVQTGKKTMLYMATSLALTAGGILFCYFLVGAKPEGDRPMNAILLESLSHNCWFLGKWFIVLTLVAEALLLLIAAQTGFIDGPRVMSNMALDSWLPHRFSSLSERLTTHWGVLLIGGMAFASLWYTQGNVDTLVTMYSINVFITFSLTELGMCKFYITHRKQHKEWKQALPIHMTGLTLCLTILALTVYEKFWKGAWMTLIVTSLLIVLCMFIRQYYRKAFSKLGLVTVDPSELGPGKEMQAPAHLDPKADTAVLLVGSYGGLGIHSFTQIRTMFRERFKQVVFISVGVVDSGNFKGAHELDGLREATQKALDQYVALARKFGMAATSFMEVGNEPVEPAAELCMEVALRFKEAMFFAGKLVFQQESVLQSLLHNQTAEAIHNRLQWLGYPMLILPIRVWGEGASVTAEELTKSTIGLGDADMNAH